MYLHRLRNKLRRSLQKNKINLQELAKVKLVKQVK